MNIKLKLMSIWVPKFILIRELKTTSDLTNTYLDNIIKKHCNNFFSVLKDETHFPLKGSLEEKRIIMAARHNLRINFLVDCLGNEKAIEKGRKEMYKAGHKIGLEARNRLGVNENIHDAVQAAKILYKVLGIDFKVKYNGDYMILTIKRCALSAHYTPDTCKIMSAVDEGVLRGLNENMGLKFMERITEGADECTACITLNKPPNFVNKNEVRK